eukprot:scaffold100223_cov17-Tisochrysis_lutea.AAC.2
MMFPTRWSFAFPTAPTLAAAAGAAVGAVVAREPPSSPRMASASPLDGLSLFAASGSPPAFPDSEPASPPRLLKLPNSACAHPIPGLDLMLPAVDLLGGPLFGALWDSAPSPSAPLLAISLSCVLPAWEPS